MTIPLKYSLRHLRVRRAGPLIAAGIIALVVTVLIVVLSMAKGIETIFLNTGEPLNFMVLHQGSLGDMSGGVQREFMNFIEHAPGVQRDSQGVPLVSPEQYVMVYLKKRGEDQGSNVMVRGVAAMGFTLRPRVQVVEGRSFRPGTHEAIVCRAISNRFQNTSIGDRVRIGKNFYTVVGIFEAGRTICDSEIWADVNLLSAEFNRAQYYSLVLVRATDAHALEALTKQIATDPMLNLRAVSESKYAADRRTAAKLIRILGIVLASIMAVGACFTTMYVMYDRVMNRADEVSLMHRLGFGRSRILLSFLVESLILSVIGGLVGSLISWPANSIATGTTFLTFREVTFNLRITPDLLISGMLLSVVIGLLGGFMPAILTARQGLTTAIREGSL